MNAEDRQAAYESIVARAEATILRPKAEDGTDDSPLKTPLDVLREHTFTIDQLRDRPPQEWLVDRIIPRRGLGIIWGESGAYKTFVALDVAARLASSLHIWMRKTMPARVLYVCGEGDEGFLERIDAWTAAHPEAVIGDRLTVLAYPPPLPEENQVWAHALATHAAELAADVVVIDTVARSFGAGSENDTRDMGMFVMACDRVRRAIDGCVIGVHHSGIERGRMRGNTALYAACDFVLALTRPAKLQVQVTNQFEAKGKAKGGAEMVEPLSFLLEEHGDSIVPRQVEADELGIAGQKVDGGRDHREAQRLVDLARGVRLLHGIVKSKRALADVLDIHADTASKIVAHGLATGRLVPAERAGWLPTDLLAWKDETS